MIYFLCIFIVMVIIASFIMGFFFAKECLKRLIRDETLIFNKDKINEDE